MEALQTFYRFTIEEYHAMDDAGILPRDRRVELIDGQVVEMSPIGRRHSAFLARLNRLFVFAFGRSAIVQPNGSVKLPPFSEPEPDLLVLREVADFYAAEGVYAPDAILAVEISDSSLGYDTRIKAPLYAREGIPELWIVDLQHDVLLVYRLESDGRFAEPERRVDGRISPAKFPSVSFDVAELLAT